MMHNAAQKSKGDTKGQKARRAARLRAWWAEYKAQFCCPCGESDPACIDFHHLDPASKGKPVSDYVGRSKSALLAELAKCIALCANCHRKAHAR